MAAVAGTTSLAEKLRSSNAKSLPSAMRFASTIAISADLLAPEFQVKENFRHWPPALLNCKSAPTCTPLMLTRNAAGLAPSELTAQPENTYVLLVSTVTVSVQATVPAAAEPSTSIMFPEPVVWSRNES